MSDQTLKWFELADAGEVDSPALLVYPQRVKHNIDLAIHMVGDPARLRPHIKTHKCVEVAQLQIAAGITQFKCATIAEAELLGMAGAADVLLAYQPVGPKLKRFVEVIKMCPQTLYYCLVDNMHSANEVSTAALAHNTKIPVYVDINVGMNRTGLVPDKVAESYLQLFALQGVKPLGLHAYDGHIHEPDIDVRNFKAAAIHEQLKAITREIKKAGLPEPIIVAGGTPTFPFWAQQQEVICSPGTFVYWDAGYAATCKEQEFLPAAVLLTRVISLPNDTTVCLDLGHKSVAAENTIDKRVSFLNAPDLQIIGQSEEHLVAEAGVGHTYQPGDVIYLLPCHVCPTVALFERMLTVELNHVTGEWLNLARNRKITC
ncbi:D-TA family PLP-dependent enzyme [Mucilaginibacter ginkgonis]|uniref:D-TA family PLP-dependent enzyme n=1 Tax=Mucilaginibacter ginkgonis TaxID=2682091 RepID=A0A6I4HYN1_9SPHI|nr:D-TA family PLP-dependent enzyme [Mucilaginibacter ginkgonis]QQL51365.1 D-TA family PLP-dependent enzyme [Mucilaginibacter ginkgonis]